ncbi:hypothetical protein B0H17DRAFT_1180050 [Mycena rosella]|uniref:Uncharacterized protein n=1 Tax=Mycena rosella TaxID=1033263 RepID=A0AAD7DEQ9_MYCRO|nr:hypothetical protein B0H17DRAFT_1180050 [Mycena rosella]
MVEAATQTTGAEAEPELSLAEKFASNIFDGIIPGTEIGGRQRRQFKWPQTLDITTEDRLLVAQEHSAANHPITIVDLIFRHRKSQEYIDGVPVQPNFILPRYGLLPSTRATAIIPIHCPNTTRNAMINWALHCMIERFETETKILLQPVHGFLHRPGDPPITWNTLLAWAMLQNQETIALHVNHAARRKLEAMVAAAVEDHEKLPDATGDGLPFIPDSSAPPAPRPDSNFTTFDNGENEDEDEPDPDAANDAPGTEDPLSQKYS